MNFKKHIEFKPSKQIWRILITDDENVIIEKRDTGDKQVYFDCFALESKKEVFTDLQLDEKFWIGIEKVYKGIIFFHLFVKPDMPDHKNIIAYDIAGNKILWQNEEYSYLFLYNGKVYCFQQQFEGRKFFTLDYKSGELIEEIGNDVERVNADYNKSRLDDDYSAYKFPETVEPENKKVKSILSDLETKLAIVGKVEYNVLENVLLASYHTQSSEKSMANNFTAIDLNSGEKIFSEILSAGTESFMTDSFFVYKHFLFLLKGKTEIVIINIE
jgi:hypothetical protein